MLHLPSQLKKITEGFRRRHAHNCTQAMNQKKEDSGLSTDGLWAQ